MSDTASRIDRPAFSMPKAAITVLIYLYLVLGSVPAISLMVLAPLLHTERDLLSDNLLMYVLVVGGWLLALLFIVRSGKLIGLYLFRDTAWLLAALLVSSLVAALLLTIGTIGDGSRHTRLAGEFAVIALLVCAPVQWLLLRGLSHVRWLDPASSATEWEPPARHKDVFLKTMTKDRDNE